MFILTNINIPNDVVQVYDTKDRSNDVIRLSIIAYQILNGSVKVHGLGVVNKSKSSTSVPIRNLGIYVDVQEAKEAMAKYYISNGMSAEKAYACLGLR